MKATLILTMGLVVLAGCGGENAGSDSPEFNDIATGVRLQRERPLEGADAAERATRLAECAGTLTTFSSQAPPPPRADRLAQLAGRLFNLSVQLGGTAGRSPDDLTRIRDQAIAAHDHLRARLPGQYQAMIAEGARRCGIAEILRDEELTGAPSQPAPPDLNSAVDALEQEAAR
jgi:hypothetical protein